ncbi:MAG: ribonuclease T [Alteraurantiacibacter sp.]
MKRAALALLLAALPATAQAQAYQCSPPTTAPSVPAITADGPVRRVPVARYSLALSWTPEFCRGRENDPRRALQCAGRIGRFGFIVHGLWPEGRGSSYPQWCPTRRAPSPALVRQYLCMTPDAALLAHEWAKHGSCMVGTPETYFRTTQVLWNSLRWPDYDRISRQDDLTVGAIRQTFADANRPFRPDQVGVRLNERGWLTELRLCYDRRFRPMRCTEAQFGPPDAAAARIWRGL